MNKAFIFDLDGVIIDDEPVWEATKKTMYLELFGQAIFEKMGSTLGINIDGIYELANKLGSNVSKEVLFAQFYKHANEIYRTAPITEGIENLAAALIENDYSISIVSASPKEWVDIVVDRLSFKNDLKLILSIYDRPDLLHKPAPDGYLEAVKVLGSSPETTIALEDSNAGIASAKAAGVYTIGLKQNLVEGYEQKGADIYAENMNDVIRIVQAFGKR